MKMMWHMLGYLALPLITFIKRHSSPRLRFWLRQNFGADYVAIPDQIRIVPDGRRFHIGPDYAYWALYFGIGHEPEATRVVRQLVRPGDIVVDVGANFGWYTTLLAEAVDMTGRVYAFEPVPSTYERLIEHLQLNQLEARATAVRAAVAEASGKAPVYVFKELSHGCASLSTLNEKEYQAVEAPVIRLDEYLRDQMVERIDFLKCDVEGSELAVLKGCGQFLYSSEAPIILVEVNEDTSRAFGFVKDDIWRYLSEVGYDHFYDIASSHRLCRITRIDDLRGQNLLCAKNKKVERRLMTSDIVIYD
jgi:FkbM family methyltransferase